MTGERRVEWWLLLSLSLVVPIGAADLLLGPDVSLTPTLVAMPLIASFRLGFGATLLVASVALVAGGALGLANDAFLEGRNLVRLLPVVVGGVLAVWAARLRVDRQRAALLLALQGSVSRILNESRSLQDATPRILRVIGDALRWDLGALWEVDERADRLRLTGRWSAPGVDEATVAAMTEGMAFERGVGLPGRVWESGLPASVREYSRDSTFPRADTARKAGLNAGFAFPVRRGARVVGVIEFFSRQFKQIDRPELDALAALGRQIGQYMDRIRVEEHRAELLEREHRARLAAERAEREGAETVALLDTLLAKAPVGFAFLNPELRYVRVNDWLAGVTGHTPAELVGRSLEETIPEFPEVISTVRRVLETGEPAIDVELTGVPSADAAPEARPRHWLASYYPVRNAAGELLGVGVAVSEITGRKRAEARATFMAEATSALNASLDYELTLAKIARLAVPFLADWCVVDMVDARGGIRRLAVAHTDPAKEAMAWELDRSYPVDPASEMGVARTIRTGESQLIPVIDESMLEAAARDDEHFRMLQGLGLRSAIVVPLVARGRPLGAVTFVSGESGRTFDEDDLAFAEDIGRRAGTAVENARLYQERSHIARTLQANLLPPHLPEIPGVELAARYRAAGGAADVGGDFYDVFPTGEHRWAVVVGDVLGKGPSAAALIGLARHTLRASAMREEDPRRILATLNEALYWEGSEESFCTAVYATIDLSDGVAVEITAAGHPLPLVLRGDGRLERAGSAGTLLGAVRELSLEPRRSELRPGDTLVVFTDGVLEARSERGVFGERRLERLLGSLMGTSAREVAERIEHDAVDFQGGRPRDDLAVLVLRRPAAEPSESALAGDVGAVATGR